MSSRLPISLATLGKEERRRKYFLFRRIFTPKRMTCVYTTSSASSLCIHNSVDYFRSFSVSRERKIFDVVATLSARLQNINDSECSRCYTGGVEKARSFRPRLFREQTEFFNWLSLREHENDGGAKRSLTFWKILSPTLCRRIYAACSTNVSAVCEYYRPVTTVSVGRRWSAAVCGNDRLIFET